MLKNVSDEASVWFPRTPCFYTQLNINKDEESGWPISSSLNIQATKIRHSGTFHLQQIVKKVCSYV